MADGQDTEDSGERTQDPTQKRIDDARKKGDVARSDEVTTFAVFGGILIAGAAAGVSALTGFGSQLAVFLSHADTLSGRILGPGGQLTSASLIGGALLAISPLLLVPAVTAIVSLLAQRSIVVAPEKVLPKLQRISPIAGFKNKFGLTGMVEFLKRFVKLAIVTVLVVLLMLAERDRLVGSVQGTAPGVVALAFVLLEKFLLAVVAAAAVLAAIDLAWVRFDHSRKLRMTLKEIRDETKEAEGDPVFKARRRARATEIATNRMLADVPGADVVIVNPTHYAVALTWSRLPGTVPVCVAKGTDHVAARIREVAAAAGVPVHRDPPTARSIHALVDIGGEIDPDHYRAVAAAIRFSDRMRERARQQGGWGSDET